DISTIQGSETVASMVVCEDGRMRRGEYRKFRIQWNLGSGARDSGFGIRDSETSSDSSRARSADSPTASRISTDYRMPPESRIPTPDARHQDDFAAMHEV